MNSNIKIGDRVITVDGSIEGVVELIRNNGNIGICFDHLPDDWGSRWLYTKDLRFHEWGEWESRFSKPMKSIERLVLLSNYKECEEVIELYLDNEDDYDE